MNSVLISIVALVVTLGILIAFHEFGHFWVARKMGVKVLRFSIGFGKPLWSRSYGIDQTQYVLAAIPLGGYVKMLDEREGDVAPEELPRAFNRQPVGKRIAIVMAGPIFNFIFAVLAYFFMYLIGVPGIKPIIGEVTPQSIAAQAGLSAGDEIKKVDDVETPTWNSARITLLDHGLDNDLIKLEVSNAENQLKTLTVDLHSITMEMKQGDLFQHLGIIPYRGDPLPPIIGEIVSGGAAERDGLKVGDRIVAVDTNPVSTWLEWVEIVQAHPEQSLQVEILRGNTTEIIHIAPKRFEVDDKVIGRIGAGPQQPENYNEHLKAKVQYGPSTAFLVAITKTWQMSVLTLRMIGKMIIGEVSLKNLSGPITIATYAGYTATIGFATFLSFLAVVSISLGVLNLLPIPILDGGHLLNYFIELVKGSALSEEIQLRMQHIGIVILGLLMTLAFYNDLRRLFGE